MVRAPVSRVKTFIATCCIGVLLLLCPLDAQALPLRIVVVVAAPEDRGLLTRVRGQTSDLETQVVAVDAAPLDVGFDAQLATARTLAQAQAAPLAIWFARSGPRLVVYVADLASGRVLARGIDQGEGAHDASAQGEAAALVVRSAVRASLAGAALNTPPAERVAVAALPAPPAQVAVVASKPMPAPAPSQPAPPKQASAPPPRRVAPPSAPHVRGADPRRERRLDAWLALGGELGRDGFAQRARAALSARVGVRAGRFEVGFGGAFGLPETREVPVGEVALARHRAVGHGGFALLARPTLRVSLALEAGVEIDMLQVRRPIASFRADTSRSALAVLGAQLSAAYAPRWTAGRIALVPSMGLAALPTRPVLGYRAGAERVRVRRLYAVEPIVRLLLEMHF